MRWSADSGEPTFAFNQYPVEFVQLGLNPAIHRLRGIGALGVGDAGFDTSEQQNGILDGLGAPNMKIAAVHGLYDFFAQDQIGLIGGWDDDALTSAEAGSGPASLETGAKEAFDLMMYATDRLGLAELIDGTGDRQVLAERYARKIRDCLLYTSPRPRD